MTITPRQPRESRLLLGWSQLNLATRFGVSAKPISAFESGEQGRQPLHLDFVCARLELAGIDFITKAAATNSASDVMILHSQQPSLSTANSLLTTSI
jgi:transcriptional regulator with XRE-family HTH domain